jgi:hypothetical protein
MDSIATHATILAGATLTAVAIVRAGAGARRSTVARHFRGLAMQRVLYAHICCQQL